LKFTKEHIIESIKSGKDREVLSAMYKEIYPKIERYVTGNTGSKDDSKDVFQEAILVFYNNVINGNYDRINEITGFIIKVSRNIWINKVRKTNKEVEANLLENYEDHTPSALITLIMDEKWAAYQDLFDNIGSRCKELLNYSVYEKISMKEIAIKMNFANENAAKAQNYRCKQKLMDLVSANEELTDLLKS
jgi:RNA polymerase sigma factor (sigma-70 family)